MRAIKILVLLAVCVVAASTALAQDMRAAPADPGATQTGMQAVTDVSAPAALRPSVRTASTTKA